MSPLFLVTGARRKSSAKRLFPDAAMSDLQLAAPERFLACYNGVWRHRHAAVMRKSRKYPDPKEQLARGVKALRQRGYSEDRVLQLVREAYREPPPEKPWALHPGWNGLNPPWRPGMGPKPE